MTKKKQLLLDDDDDDDKSITKKSSLSSPSLLQINTKYATEYERRKRYEELLNSKQENVDVDSNNNNDDDSSDSSDEDEDAILSTPHVDVQIFKTLRAIRNKDSIIYDPNQTFFPSSSSSLLSHNNNDDDDDDASSSSFDPLSTKTSRKVKRYKDLVRETMLKKMNQDQVSENESENEEKEIEQNGDKHRLAYNIEQVELRNAFLNSVGQENDDEEEDLLLQRYPQKESLPSQKNLFILQKEMDALKKTQSKSTFIDPRGEIKDGEGFLLDYLTNRKWVDTTFTTTTATTTASSSSSSVTAEYNHRKHDDLKQSQVSYDFEDKEEEEDDSLDELDKTDAFESKYNFRFEEMAAAAAAAATTTTLHGGPNTQLVGYSRTSLSDTLRRKEDTRKLKREERKEKKQIERKAKEERLKRLKNAKREDLEQRVKKIKGVIKNKWKDDGDDDDDEMDENVLLKLLDGDYDADNFDQLMNQAFGDKFYEKKEEEWKSDKDVKASFKEDPEYQDSIVVEEEEEDVFYEGEGEDMDYAEDDDAEKTELEQKLDAKLEEELYKLDYEDIIDDLPTRFKYRSVEANNYGLTAEEILRASDSHLKQYVSLKKMAPYVEEQYNPGSKRRKRFREILKKEISHAESELKDHGVESLHMAHETESSQKANQKRRRQKKRKQVAKTSMT